MIELFGTTISGESLVVVGAAVVVVGIVAYDQYEGSSEYDHLDETGDEKLTTAFDPLPSDLAEKPAVSEVEVVNEHRDGSDIVVPAITVIFEDAGEPSQHRVWELVADALTAVDGTFDDVHVRHFDLQFSYADENEEEVIYRRIAVGPDLADRFLTEPGFGTADLRTAVEEGDDGDDETPPVFWQEFDAESADGSGAAIAGATAACSAGAAASCAGGAAAAGGAAGGAC